MAVVLFETEVLRGISTVFKGNILVPNGQKTTENDRHGRGYVSKESKKRKTIGRFKEETFLVITS